MNIAAVLLGVALLVIIATAGLATTAAVRGTRINGAVRPLERWSRSVAGAMGATAILLAIPAIGDRLNAATHVDNLSMLLAHLFGIACLTSLRVLLVTWTYPPSAREAALRLRFATAGAFTVAATIAFAMADRSGIAFINADAQDGGVGTYLMITDSYWVLAGAMIARDCIPLAIDNARSGHRTIAVGQALLAAGGAASALWGATEAAYVALTHMVGGAWSLGVQDAVSSSLAALYGICLFAGIAASAMRPAVTRQ
ncbi:hypothetical protein [Kitasatospora brasiliensis]|uniref:hypothetical protein n=1 Tax=Kitasatospora brasiliensis TaxID=3058040 RepID=UPI00292E5B99|nr:hypothetical protein [Kitasatospora sp. K002]